MRTKQVDEKTLAIISSFLTPKDREEARQRTYEELRQDMETLNRAFLMVMIWRGVI